MNPWPMVKADLRAMRWSALAVVLLVALAVAIGVAVGTQERALRGASARAAAPFDLLIAAPGSQTQLVLSTVYLQLEALPLIDGAILTRLAADPRVAAVAPLAFGDVIAGAPVIGTVAAFAGRSGFSAGRVFERENEAVVGADVALALGAKVSPAHGHAEGRVHEDSSYTIVGRLARQGTPWDRAILVPIESVWEIHGLGDGHAAEGAPIGPPFEKPAGMPAVVVTPKGVAQAYALRAQYRQGGTMAVFPGEVLVSLYAVLGDVRDAMLVMAGLNNLLVLLAVLLLVAVLAAQRRRRVAVLRALGAPAAYVLAVTWLATTLPVAAGAALGLLLGWAGGAAAAARLGAATGLTLDAAPGLAEAGFAAAVAALGGMAALLPAWLTCRRNISADLRA
jgi:putative ABC transport system permease protein